MDMGGWLGVTDSFFLIISELFNLISTAKSKFDSHWLGFSSNHYNTYIPWSLRKVCNIKNWIWMHIGY